MEERTKKINDIINQLNPGRRVDMEKICPLIGKECFGSRCNAYTEELSINVVTHSEVVHNLLHGKDNWRSDLEKDGWKLGNVLTNGKTWKDKASEETDYIFTRTYLDYGNVLNTHYGRCTWGVK